MQGSPIIPKISIITVCYNSESTIESTIKSVVRQNYSNFEYIIIDGGSSDGTVNIANKYANQIDCIVSEKDNGIYDAMNKGIDICKGDYVIFINSGDQLFNNSVLTDAINESSGQDIIYGDLMLDYKNGTQKRKPQPTIINKFLFINSTVLHPATLVKRKLFQEYGKFNEKYKFAADYDFFLRVVFKPDVTLLYIPKVITVFDMYGISNDPEMSSLRLIDRLKIQKEHLPLLHYLISKTRFSLLNRRHQYIPRQVLHLLNKVIRHYAWN